MSAMLDVVREVSETVISNSYIYLLLYVSPLNIYIGCGQLLVTDGIWKLNYPVCLYKVPVTVRGVRVNLPDCCRNQPLHGKPFCQLHADHLTAAGVPVDIVGFLGHLKKLLRKDSSIIGKQTDSYIVLLFMLFCMFLFQKS